jgi:hypothetical protein
VAVGLASLPIVLALDLIAGDTAAPRGDERIYERMATDPGATHTFPFGYRVLPPWLVHVLPGGHTLGFSVLAWLAAAIAAGCMFALLERQRVARHISIPLAIALAACPVLLAADVRQGRSPDPWSVAVLSAGALCITARAPRALCAVVLVGALNREAALFLIPWAYAAWARRPLDPAALRRVALVAATGLVAYAALRLAIPTVGRESVVGYGDGLLDGRVDVVDQVFETPGIALRRLALAFGPLWLVAPLALRDFDWARRALAFAVPVALSMTFALDWGRIAVLAAPAVYPAAAHVLERRPRWVLPVLGVWWCVICAYAVYLGLHGLDQGQPAYPVR